MPPAGRADRDRLARHLRALSEPRDGVVKFDQAAAGDREQLVAASGERDVTRGAVEQAEADVMLQLTDQKAQP
ncbi:MAG: hypothetical protein ABI877_10490 [Gemmatimonadaceae bacterium]